MEITKQIVTEVRIDAHTRLENGDTVKFIANNGCQMGEFVGVTSRGCLRFKGTVDKTVIYFNVKPTSIKAVEIVERG